MSSNAAMADAPVDDNLYKSDDSISGMCASFPIKEWREAMTVDDDTIHLFSVNLADDTNEDSLCASDDLNCPSDSPVIPEEVEFELSPHTSDIFDSLSESKLTAHVSEPSLSCHSSPTSTPSNSNDSTDKVVDDAETAPKTKKKWANALPPCRVCAQPASGLHYGVNTCEACKVFFKRCVARKRPLRCKGKKQNCHVRGVKRITCAYCRYQWCLTLGMSRDSIKLGRYTHSQRDQNCKEVTKMAAVTPQSVTPKEMEQLTAVLLEAHKHVFTSWDMSEEDLLSRARQCKEQTELEQELFGHFGEISAEEYEQIYCETGLDVDGREKILRVYANCMELQVRGFVNFAKGIPGFRSLPLDDQANLLKAARAEMLILGVYRGYIHEFETYVNPVGICFDKKGAMSALGLELQQKEYAVSKKLKGLNVLTKGELVLLKAVCLMSSDRCDLKAKDTVDEIQWKLVCVLLKSLQMNHKSDDVIHFSYIIDCLVELRSLTDMNRKAHEGTPLAASVFSRHPMLFEVFYH